jgi:hypothetical protein
MHITQSGKNIKNHVTNTENVIFEDSAAVNNKISILCDVTSFSMLHK